MPPDSHSSKRDGVTADSFLTNIEKCCRLFDSQVLHLAYHTNRIATTTLFFTSSSPRSRVERKPVQHPVHEGPHSPLYFCAGNPLGIIRYRNRYGSCQSAFSKATAPSPT